MALYRFQLTDSNISIIALRRVFNGHTQPIKLVAETVIFSNFILAITHFGIYFKLHLYDVAYKTNHQHGDAI